MWAPALAVSAHGTANLAVAECAGGGDGPTRVICSRSAGWHVDRSSPTTEPCEAAAGALRTTD